MFLTVQLLKQLKDYDMSHISTHYSGKIRISEGDKKITINSECKDTLLMIRDYILSEWKEISSCVI